MEAAHVGTRRSEGMSGTEGLDSDEEHLRASEVADVLHVSPQTVSRWAADGKIRHIVTAGGHRRFPRSEVERLRSVTHGDAYEFDA